MTVVPERSSGEMGGTEEWWRDSGTARLESGQASLVSPAYTETHRSRAVVSAAAGEECQEERIFEPAFRSQCTPGVSLVGDDSASHKSDPGSTDDPSHAAIRSPRGVASSIMASRRQYSPLCDVHHTAMQGRMLPEDSAEMQSCHACERRDCTRVFRDSSGYSDWVNGGFDESRALIRNCPACGQILYLAEVDQSRKLETWECPGTGCEFSEESPSPAAR